MKNIKDLKQNKFKNLFNPQNNKDIQWDYLKKNTSNSFLYDLTKAIEHSNTLKESFEEITNENDLIFLKSEEFLNKKNNFTKNISNLVIPKTKEFKYPKLLKKRNWNIAHNRDFFFNKSKGLMIRNRYFKILKNTFYQNKYFSFKRIKGEKTESNIFKNN